MGEYFHRDTRKNLNYFIEMYEPDEETTRTFKIIIIGDTNVGKTCLAFRFCGGRFPDKTEATIGVDFREKQVTIDGEEMKVVTY